MCSSALTVVSAGSQPLPRPAVGTLPRNRLASSAAGGASALSSSERASWQTEHTLATCANGAPNVVPVAFKDVTAEGKLAVGDVVLDITPEKVIVTTPGADNKKGL